MSAVITCLAFRWLDWDALRAQQVRRIDWESARCLTNPKLPFSMQDITALWMSLCDILCCGWCGLLQQTPTLFARVVTALKMDRRAIQTNLLFMACGFLGVLL